MALQWSLGKDEVATRLTAVLLEGSASAVREALFAGTSLMVPAPRVFFGPFQETSDSRTVVSFRPACMKSP